MRGKVMVDGPLSVEIAGDLVTIRGTSDGEAFALVGRLEDALITAHRFENAVASALKVRAENRVIPLHRAHAADSA